MKSLIVLGSLLALTAVFFQNCSAKNFNMDDSSLNDKSEAFALVDMTIAVDMNRPKDFDAAWTGDKGELILSASDTEVLSSIRTPNGIVVIQNGRDFKVTYTPNSYFRGEDEVRLYGVDANGKGGKPSGLIRFQVGNSIGLFKPALALRGASCTTCHAQVESNLITDFGHGNYYLETGRGSITNYNYGFYTDHGYTGAANSGSLVTMKMAATSETIVPKADLVGYLKDVSGETSLAGYIRNRFAASSHASTKTAANLVREANSVFIGAPNRARLLQVFGESENTGSMKYIPEVTGLALSGVPAYSEGRFQLSGVVRCDGDLLLQGTVHMNGVQIQTYDGCRIYATGSIFVSNGLTVSGLGGSPDFNVQLVSSRAIGLGMGNTLNAAGTATCETTGWYASRFNGGTNDQFTKSSIQTRWNLHQETSYTRAYGAGSQATAFLTAVIAEATPLNMQDATCEAGGRGQAFSRVLIVAPRVDSRYNGNFSGSIIAESSVLSIGSFKFSFDPVFERVSVLPLLNDSDYLKITE